MIFDPQRCENLHSRNIHIVSYLYGEDAIALEGRLTDDRLRQIYTLFGEKRPAGIVHDMVVRMIVRGPKLVIEEIEAEMVSVPNPDCRGALCSLLPLKGEGISAGFTAKVHRMVGGVKGCAHLVALCRAMASAAIQGAWSAVASQPLSEGKITKRHLKSVLNTCHLWRPDGPLVKQANELLDK
jgi:hypothetical protein